MVMARLAEALKVLCCVVMRILVYMVNRVGPYYQAAFSAFPA